MRSLPVTLPVLDFESAPPLDADSSCTRCELRTGVRSVCLRPELVDAQDEHSHQTLYVIGSHPVEADDRHGRPFMGQAGSYLRDLLKRLWKGPIVYDNAVRCAPGARKVDHGPVEACRPYLSAIRQEVLPHRILCLGVTAIHSVMGASYLPYSVRRGYAYLGATPVFLLQQPVMALRNRFQRAWFEADMAWALTALPERPPSDAVALMVTTPQEAQDAVADCRLADDITWDLETFGRPFNAEGRILNLAITPRGAHYAWVWDHSELERPDVARPAFDLLRSYPSGGQNIKFDCIHLEARYGVRVENVQFDTMLWARILDSDALVALENLQTKVGMGGAKRVIEQEKSASKKELSLLARGKATPDRFSGIPKADLERALRRVQGGDDPMRYLYAGIRPDLLRAYNAADTISTSMVREHLEGEFAARPELQQVWPRIVRDMNYALTRMEFNGICVNRDAIDSLRTMMQSRIDDIRTRLSQYDEVKTVVKRGVPTEVVEPFNPNSGAQVATLLFQKLGLKPKGTTATGKYQTGADVLETINHPVCRDIVAFRSAVKFLSNYADGMSDAIQDDGRIHPNYNVQGTGTGRPSCDDPNLFNIPRPTSPEGKICRDIFCAPDVDPFSGQACDMVLVEADYSQIELRVAAMLSGDPIMISFFQQGIDFHLATAKLIAPYFGLNPDDITKAHPLRDQAKTVNFATLYGDPPQGLAAKLNISVKLAVKLQDAILGKFLKLKQWIDSCANYGRKHGSCRTFWDGQPLRERALTVIAEPDHPGFDTALRSSWNTPVQGSAADFMNASLGAIQRWFDADFVPARLVLTVYDSVIVETRRDIAEDVAHGMKSIMEGHPVLHNIPILAEFKIGKSWGSMSKLDLEAA